MRRSVRYTGLALLVVILLSSVAWYAVALESRGDELTVSFLDVGQGDAVFIDAPSGRQVLIDGGASTQVLRALSDVLPWYDRTIDIVIGTHPDADHIGGLIDVFPRYEVGMVVQSSVLGTTPIWETFRRDAEAEGAKLIEADRGQIIDLGGGAYLEVLFPDRNVANIETNTGCIVTRLVYGDTAFMLSCDAPDEIEKYLVQLDGKSLKANVLKAGHHGSKTSSAPLFLGFVDPEYAVFSRGCDNRYGHPASEVVERYASFDIPTFDTCTDGTVTFVSDGQAVHPR